MRHLLYALFTICLLTPSTYATTFSLVSHTSAGATGAPSTITTGSIDTTGATLLVACLGTQYEGGSASLTVPITDSKGNTWWPAGDAKYVSYTRMFYSIPTSVGTGHTFTGNAYAPSLAVAAYTGTATNGLDNYNESPADGAHTGISFVTYTPSNANNVIVTCITESNGATPSIDSGFTKEEGINTSGGNHWGISYGDKIQSSASSASPTWSWGFSFNDNGTVATAIFSYDSSPLPNPPTSPYNIVARTYKQSSDNKAVTTDSIDTSGSTLLVACVGNDGTTHSVTPTLTDSMGNTWTAGTAASGAENGIKMFYVINPTVGSGHTFTSSSATTNYPVIMVMGLSYTGYNLAFDKEASAVAGLSPTSISSQSPTSAGELLMLCAHSEASSGFSYLATNNSTTGGNIPWYLISMQGNGTTPDQQYNMVMGLKYLSGTGANVPSVYAYGNNGAHSNAAAIADMLFGQGSAIVTCPKGLMLQGAGCE